MEKVRRLITVCLAATLVFGLVSSVSALSFDVDYDAGTGLTVTGDYVNVWSGKNNGNPETNPASLVYQILNAAGVDLYYKATRAGDVETGSLTASYDAVYDSAYDVTINYEGGGVAYINPPPVYIFIKDGNSEPYNWYLFETMWNGLDLLEFKDFWVDWDGAGNAYKQGGFSHVSLYGKGTAVPEPSMMLLLGLGLLGLARAGWKFKK